MFEIRLYFVRGGTARVTPLYWSAASYMVKRKRSAGRTPTSGRFVRYPLTALDNVIGPSGRVWMSVASRAPI